MINMRSIKHLNTYFESIIKITEKLDLEEIEKLIDQLLNLRNLNGRLFFLGVGGSAANASHAVNDFRKLCGIECYSPADNISELTARINDEGWDTVFAEWLKISKLNKKDALFILSVGGGSLDAQVSVNLIKSIDYAKKIKSKIFGIVGRDGGYTKANGDNIILIPN